MSIKFTYRNLPNSLPFNPFLLSHTLENMKDNGLGKIFNVQAYELETASNLDVVITGLINRSVIGSYTITFSVINVNNEVITEEKVINVVGGSKYFDSTELKITERVTIDNYTVTDISNIFTDMIFNNESDVLFFASSILNRFTFYDSDGYKTIGCFYLSDGDGGNDLVDLTFSSYSKDSFGVCISFHLSNSVSFERIATCYFKFKNIDTTQYNKTEIDTKFTLLLDRIAALEESVNTSTVNSNTKIDPTQFAELKLLLQGLGISFLGGVK